MLSRVARASIRRSARNASRCGSKRTFVQPTSADRASIVDIPAEYDSHFTPRAGGLIITPLSNRVPDNLFCAFADMFGFKVEVPKREGSLKDKTRAIYLDMQVRSPKELLNLSLSLLLHRLRLLWTQEYWTQCYLSIRISMAILTVALTHTDGKLKRVLMRLAR